MQVSTAPAASPHVAQLANGGIVVVWNSGDFGARAVYAQRFDANGQKAGEPITVFAGGSTNGWDVRNVTALPDGSFLVAAKGEIVTGTPLQLRLYVQKLDADGRLVATGGTRDPAVNGGQADLLLSENESDTIDFVDVQVFPNADGSYSLATVRIGHPVPVSASNQLLLNVDAFGNVVNRLNLSDGYSQLATPPVVTRLRGGNFLVAGTSTITYAPVVWKIVTGAGVVVAQQSLGAAPGNGTSDPHVAALADGSGLLSWRFANSVQTGTAAQRIDASGQFLGTATVPDPTGSLTGLAQGGYLFAWTSGTQLMAQYFSASGQAAGDAFVVAELGAVDSSTSWSIAPTTDGFIAAYVASTADGPRPFETRFPAPSLS